MSPLVVGNVKPVNRVQPELILAKPETLLATVLATVLAEGDTALVGTTLEEVTRVCALLESAGVLTRINGEGFVMETSPQGARQRLAAVTGATAVLETARERRSGDWLDRSAPAPLTEPIDSSDPTSAPPPATPVRHAAAGVCPRTRGGSDRGSLALAWWGFRPIIAVVRPCARCWRCRACLPRMARPGCAAPRRRPGSDAAIGMIRSPSS